MKVLNILFLSVFISFSFSSFSAETIDLDQYLKLVEERSRRVLAAKAKMESSQFKSSAAGLNLEPILTSKVIRISDESQPNQLGKKSEITTAQVGIQKQFQSGTAAAVTVSGNEVDVTNPLVPSLGEYTTGTVELSVKQSLWKDGFGSNTKRILSREKLTAQIELQASDLEYRRALIDAENDFWDYIVAKEDLKLKVENLDRAQKLEKWTQNRVGNGISDQADLMNAKALGSLRAVQLLTAEDELKAQESQLRQNLELANGEPLPMINGDLEKRRSLNVDRLRQRSNVLPLAAQLAIAEAQIKILISEEKLDGLKPDLSAFATYASNSFDRTTSDAVSNVTDGKLPKSTIGIAFSMPIGTGAKKAFEDASLGEARAAALQSQKALDEGRDSWSEFLRRYDVVLKNVENLKQLSSFQDRRLKAERDKFSRGRTVTATVVTAETEAAEAIVNALKAKSTLRKLEASSLLFEGN